MQDREKKLFDTRSFREIWNSLGTRSAMQLELRDNIIAKLRITRQAVNKWGVEGVAPKYESVRKTVSDIVNRTLGTNTNYKTLFPQL